jgi:hypothetical protein
LHKEVIRENHIRLKKVSPELQSMLSERGELRKQLGQNIGLPSYEYWWKSVQADTRVQLTLRALQYVNRKQNGKPRTPKPTFPSAYLQEDELHQVPPDTDGIKPGAWKPVAEQMVHLFRESILKVMSASTDKKTTELIHNILMHVFKSHLCLLPQMQPWESPHQNAAGCTELQTWRTEEAPVGWGRLDHGPVAEPILCSLESGKAALSPEDWHGSPI